VAVALSVADPLTGPFVGPNGVGSAAHRPCVTRLADSSATDDRAVPVFGTPNSSGTPLSIGDASKSAGIVEVWESFRSVDSAGTSQVVPNAVAGNGIAIVGTDGGI